MALVTTDAIVLHAFDYLESSRIMRLLTRERGVRSVLARGARRSSRRFGSGVDLFVEGSAELYEKPGRELDAMGAFDVTRARPMLGEDLGRFTGASALAELTLRFGRDDPDLDLFGAMSAALDALAAAPAARARSVALAGAWQLLGAMGFAPQLEQCADCHASLGDDEPVLFNHPSGGLLCERCARLARAGRRLPPRARATLRTWIAGADAGEVPEAEARAHQRLLREFVQEHLADDRPLRAFEVWEHAAWSAA